MKLKNIFGKKKIIRPRENNIKITKARREKLMVIVEEEIA